MTLRTTAFVENDEGFGVTQAFDIDKVLNDEYLFRLSNSVRMSEKTEGVRWRIRPALYQAIDYRRAMRYEAFVRGETDGAQPDLYGVAITHRRSAWRDWLFFEFGAELFWADGPEPGRSLQRLCRRFDRFRSHVRRCLRSNTPARRAPAAGGGAGRRARRRTESLLP